MNDLTTRLREAGKNGHTWRDAQTLAEQVLADPCDAEAFDRAMDAFEEGLADRSRAAIARAIEAWSDPVDPFIPVGKDVEPTWVEHVDLAEYYDVAAIDLARVKTAGLTTHDAQHLIEVAAQTAWLEPEKIVSIVSEFAPLPDRAHRLAELALSDFQRRPIEAPTPVALSVAALPAPTPAIVAQVPADYEFDLEAEPGLLGDIARWSQTFAYRPVREFAQPAALATLATLFGRRWATPTGLGLNLYLVAIAETGGGKDALLGAPRRLVAAAGFRHLLGPGDFTSDAAIETSLRMRPAQLMPLDEFGKLAQAMMGRNAPAFAKLAAKCLLEVYPRSEPGSEWTGKQRANPEFDNAAEPIFSPTLSILGVSTPEGFFEGMSQQTLEDGFLNRLTVIRAGKEGDRQREASRRDPPAALIDAIRAAYGALGNIKEAERRSATSEPEIRTARWADDQALAALEAIEAWQDDAAEKGRRGVCGRVAEQSQKIATIRALSRDAADPAVTAEDLRWAFAVVKSSVETIEQGAREMMAGSEFETLCNAILAAVTRAGANGLAMSHLVRAKGVSKAHQRDVEAALQRLKIAEQIYVDIGPTRAGDRPSGRVRRRFEAE
jgi:hypothetical protein